VQKKGTRLIEAHAKLRASVLHAARAPDCAGEEAIAAA